MPDHRINKHPILEIPIRKKIYFYWKEKKLTAYENETIASALFANGIRIFGHHPKDHAPQGLFCANGQCSQCLVIANGKPVKSCMELVRAGMKVNPIDDLPKLPQTNHHSDVGNIPKIKIPVLIIGGGPAGLSAAIELGKRNVQTILIDDKQQLGGKLVLQTHRFFGSSKAVYAGKRGIEIAKLLSEELQAHSTVKIWTNSTALAVFKDQYIGVLRNGKEYVLIKPQMLLTASGAREKSLAFKGNTLPGVFGGGAFQTLVNRDLVRPAEKLFIVGGGNVGLIAGYHALQAGIGVVGLVEALPECGGYKVHKDKLVRSGVPIYTSHSILSANGEEEVESVTIAKIDHHFKPIPGTEKSFECDCVLIAVGLESVNEFYQKAKSNGMQVYAAGDADEIAEASAAIYAGKIKGLEIARALGIEKQEIPQDWYHMGDILKSKPGKTYPEILPEAKSGVVPVLHCTQEIPCDPCTTACARELIQINQNDIRSIPKFIGKAEACLGCKQCISKCPGLAITLVDYRKDPELPIVSLPFEFEPEILVNQGKITVLDTEGGVLGKLPMKRFYKANKKEKTWIIDVQAPKEYAERIAGIQIQDKSITHPMQQVVDHINDDTIICRCERVTAGEILKLIRSGCRDLNEIKAVTRAGMGACGGKTCTPLIHSLFRQEGITEDQIVTRTIRPLFVEIPLGVLAGLSERGDDE